MSAIFGLDFGTSNSAISANINGEVQLINVDKNNPIQMSLKSVLYFYEEGTKRESYVGHEAVQKYIENEAEGRYMQSIKSFLTDQNFQHTEIFCKYYTLEKLISLILRTMKERAENQLKREIVDVVLGRPVVFSEDVEKDNLAQKRLTDAAKLAGFKNIYFQLEPIAAAFSYENTLSLGQEKKILVGDFGAGTSDFTVIKVENRSRIKSDRKDDILSTDGVYIGGDIFDSEIMWEKICKYYGKDVKVKSMMSNNLFGLSPMIIGNLRRWHLIPQLRLPSKLRSIKEYKFLSSSQSDKQLFKNLENLINYNYGYLLFQAVEKAKFELSDTDSSCISFNDYNILIEEKISRTEFEGYMRDKVEKIDNCIKSSIKLANLKYEDIDVIFLTGGSSYIPLIRKAFEIKFPKHKIIQSNAFTSVALGLGLYGSNII